MERLISGCIPSCSPWFQLHCVSSLLHWERWLKDVSVCELVRRHTSITVSLHWLNVPLMREGECDCGDGWGGGGGGRMKGKLWRTKREKKQKALIQESWLLSRFHSIHTSGFWWRKGKTERENEREREHLCVGGWGYVHVSVHVWIRLHVGAENNCARQQYGVSVGCLQLIIRS